MATIFEITEKRMSLLHQLEALEGDLTEIEESWEGNKAEIAQKVDSYLYVLDRIDVDITAIEAVIERLQAVKKSKESNVQRLRDTLKFAVSKYDTIELTEGNNIGRKLFLRGSEAIEVHDISLLPIEYQTKTVTYKPDKAAIKEAIKSGNDVPGAVLVRNQNLVIK